MHKLYPNQYVKSVYDVDFASLFEKGYRGVLFDVDNTLVPFDVMDADERLMGFVNGLRETGFELGLVSNNSAKRVAALNNRLKMHMMPNAMKPLRRNLLKILDDMGVPAEKAVFVGDQVFTDVWVGNRCGMHTILVEPIQHKEQFITWIKRGTENLVLKGYHRHRKSPKRKQR